MQHFQDILSLTATPKGLWAAYDLIGFDDLKVTADDAPVKGVAKHPVTEIGLHTAVIVIGTVRVKAVGVITAGTKVVSAAAGGVKAAGASPANAFATALTSAADGQFVSILIR